MKWDWIAKVFSGAGGRAITFAWAALAMAFILAWVGKLNAEFVAAIAAIHGFVVYRAVQADKNGNGGPQNG